MLLKVFALLPLLFAVPEVKVNFSGTELAAINVYVEGEDKLFATCLKSGLELRYRFEVQLCKRRPAWFDSCPDYRLEKHGLSYDPISGNYTLVSDRHGDEVQPRTQNFSTRREAVEAFTVVKELPLLFVARGQEKYFTSHRSYLRVRVASDCRGGYNETLASVSSFLTFGLLRVSGFDTDWVTFNIRQDQPEQAAQRSNEG